MVTETRVFRQVRNDEKDIEAICDSYESKIGHERWIAEAIQKDAIQNSWDAREHKKTGKGWECGFEIKSIVNRKYLCILDKGTHGLSGTTFSDEKELSAILTSGKRKEDLAYFLSSNWSGKSSEEGGSRGRGKTLFLAASRDGRIYFDSLRLSDNLYLFGEYYLDKDKQIKFKLCYQDAAKEELARITDGKMFPLRDAGTRILILNPKPAVEEAIKDGSMLAMINNSRWEIIKKYQAKIYVNNGFEMKYATLPSWYLDNFDEAVCHEYKPRDKDKYGGGLIKKGKSYRIKKLVLRYKLNNNLPESIRGLAIQRGGMTIQRLLPDGWIHEEGMNNIYGWVEMDRELENEMNELCEGPEHLDFSWHKRPAKYLSDYLKSKIRDFAKELKLIESEKAKKNKIQKAAEEKALKSLTSLFKKLKLFGKNLGKRKRGTSSRQKNEPLRLSISDIKFPRENRRVNYGEKIENVYVYPINEFEDSIMVLVRLYIVSDKGRTILFDEKEFNLQPGKGPKIGFETVKISQELEKGGYVIKAKMRSLEDSTITFPDGTNIEKGTKLYDRIHQKFYVEVAPPEHGPLHFEPKGRDDKGYIIDWEPEGDSGYIIYYNEVHPRIKILVNDESKLAEYLTEQGALVALQIKLEEVVAEGESDDEDLEKLLKSKELGQVIPTILKRYSEFLWDYREA